MATAADIINGALDILGVTEEGQSGTTTQLAIGLVKLNDLIDSWNSERLTLFQEYEETFTLTTASQYTIGSGQTFNTTRPERIISALYKQTGGTDYYGIKILTSKIEWDRLSQRTISDFPSYLWYDNAYPNGTINIYPQQAGSLVLTTIRQLPEFAATSTTVSLPPGYRKALKYNLAIDLQGPMQCVMSQIDIRTAVRALASIKRANQKTSESIVELAYMSNDRYYIKSDE
jgi:hypothetical protein